MLHVICIEEVTRTMRAPVEQITIIERWLGNACVLFRQKLVCCANDNNSLRVESLSLVVLSRYR